MPADIVVKVGAALDRSTETVFADVERRARAMLTSQQRATRTAANEERRLSTEGAKAAKYLRDAKVKAELEVYRENAKLNRLMLQEEAKTVRALTVLHEREATKRMNAERSALAAQAKMYGPSRAEFEKNEIKKTTIAERESKRRAKAESRDLDRFASRTSQRATRFFFPRPEGALGYGKRVVGDLMRGAGIDLTLGGGVGRARERETAGMELAQQERIATGKTKGGEYWAGISKGVANDLKVAPEDVTAMMRAFTGKTGDFAAAADKAKELASMTAASGANMNEMGSAAGFVYNQLKGMPDAASLTLDVMRGIVGQTAVGAVEMEEYASQMGRVAANAKSFAGSPAENIKILSALAQMSIAEGGATSGADAARSVAAFSQTTNKSKRIHAFQKYGVDVFTDSSKTQKKGIMQLIDESILASKGNLESFSEMWADTLGQKPTRAMLTAFNQAGGGKKGLEAAHAKIAPYMSAQMSPEQERQNNADRQRTLAAKAQDFQNKLDSITESLANRLLPVLEKSAPAFLALTNVVSGWVRWAAENPWKAVMAALVLSVGRAGFESAGRLVVEKILKNFMVNGGVPVQNLTAGQTVTGTAGALAMGAATFMITSAILNAATVTMQEEKRRRAENYNKTYEDFTRDYTAAKTPEERKAILERASKNVDLTHESRGKILNAVSTDEDYNKTRQAMADFIKQLAAIRENGQEAWKPGDLRENAPTRMDPAEIGRNTAMALGGVTLKVEVKNVDDFNNASNTDKAISMFGGLPGAFNQSGFSAMR